VLRGHGQGPELRPAEGDRRRLNRVHHGAHYSRARAVRKGGKAGGKAIILKKSPRLALAISSLNPLVSMRAAGA